MPLYVRTDSPFWWLRLGDSVRESTKFPHGGRATPHAALDADALRYEAARAHDYHEALRAERLGLTPEPARVAVSFREAAADWLGSDARAKSRDRLSIAWLIDKPAPGGPQIGALPVTEVAAHEVIKQIRALSDAHQGRAQRTTDRYMGTLSAVLNHAHAVMGELPQPVTVPLYNPPQEEPAYYTPEQFAALCEELPAHLRLAAVFAVATLLRMSAMLSLTWDAIDWANRVAFIRRANQKGKRSSFKFPLNSAALAALERLKLRRVPRCPYVFHWEGKRVKDCNTQSFQNALARVGLGKLHGTKHNWHSLRHTGATWARQAGRQDGEIQDLGGWLDSRMVRRYGHHGPVPRHIHEASEALTGGSLARLLGDPGEPGEVIRPDRGPSGVDGGNGAAGDRTPDLLIANQVLSQLSYRPANPCNTRRRPPSLAVVPAQKPHVGDPDHAPHTAETSSRLNDLRERNQQPNPALRRYGHRKKSTG
jgi:integrase